MRYFQYGRMIKEKSYANETKILQKRKLCIKLKKEIM